MSKQNNQLERSALDLRVAPWRAAGNSALAAPRSGWVRAIRTALDMSLEQLARRLGVGRSSVLRLEEGERTGRIQLDTLRRAAEALDCELHYVLVPRRPLEETVAARRREVARARLRRTAHTMALEGQYDANDPLARKLLEQAEAEIPDRALWDEKA